MEELAYTGQWLREHPDTVVELGRDKHKLQHLCLLRAPARNLAWCGAKVTQHKAKREMTVPKLGLPAGICVQCRMVYQGMGKL